MTLQSRVKRLEDKQSAASSDDADGLLQEFSLEELRHLIQVMDPGGLGYSIEELRQMLAKP